MNVDMVASAPLILRVVNEQGQPVRGAELVWTFPDLKPLDSSMVGDRELRELAQLGPRALRRRGSVPARWR